MKENFLKEALCRSYDKKYDYNGVSGERVASRLGQLAMIGLTKDRGSNRPGYSRAEKEAKDLVSDWMHEAGLDVYMDGAGNVFGKCKGNKVSQPAILCGSHLDSVPNGGHFDGPLGVIAALEVVEAWKETRYNPEKPFEIAVFSDEEGARFNGGLNGSEAIVGKGSLAEKMELVDGEGRSFSEVLQDVGLSVDSYAGAKRDMEEIELFVEVHIEQGKRLEKENLPCGIVTGIAGPCWLEVTFHGEAGHAGNTPMEDRKDALVAAAAFIQTVHTLPQQVSDSAVATIGKMKVTPNGVNVIPGEVSLYVDIRDITQERRDSLVTLVLATANKIAADYKVTVEHDEKMRVAPVPIDEGKQALLVETMEEELIRPYHLPSGAGHDAMILGSEIPVAMLFTRSKEGVSHNPAEWSDLNDCVQTIHVLKKFIEKLNSEN
ncbi:M20 family metallo-hydrolase [Virgibacillus halodenitrificans]|uniref:M20 family metallo-hydrolase n=1 Tax=Virgibacillus halodenitrificans TaxID=1482 RepID=UPI002DBC8D60|nr:M20 family metallo-hydrolase [Virgibacillus halodenitrificans]MEC2160632.1 M20 family metallo-hydrolase [Virgibacillus halodenitrificans]